MSKMDDFKYFNRDSLNLLGIRDLRRLGFSVGVCGYTTYSKQDLIDHILAVVTGFESPKTEASKGRPTSITKPRNEVLCDIIAKLKSFEISYDNNPLPMVASSAATYDTGLSKTNHIEGTTSILEDEMVVMCENNGFWNKVCTIPQSLVSNLGIKPAQQISGTATKSLVGYTLTNTNYSSETKTDFDQLLAQKSNQTVQIENGQNLVVGGRNAIFANIEPEKIASKFKNTKTIYLNVFAAPEEQPHKFDINYICSFVHPLEMQKSIAFLAFEKAKRLVEEGNDVLLVVGSLSNLARVYEPVSTTNLALAAATTDCYLQLRKLVATAHCTQMGNITLAAICSASTPLDFAILEQLIPAFGNIIK